MKKYFLALVLLGITLPSISQFYNYATGPVFPYPVSGVGKMISVKDGGIMFLQINTDSFINVQYYEPKYHALTQQKITLPFFPMKNAKIENVFAFNGDALLFLSSHVPDSSLLYMISISGQSGKLNKAEIIRNIHHTQKAKSSNDEMVYPQFIVRHSEKGDAYAVGTVNPGKFDGLPVLQVSVFDTLGNELKRPYKSELPEKFNNLSPVDIVVISPDQAVLLSYGYTVEQNIKDGDVIMAMVEKAKPDMRISQLAISPDFVLQHAVARYDSLFKKIFLLAFSNRQSNSNKLVSEFVRIDVPTLKFDNDSILGFNEITTAKLKQLTGEEAPEFVPVDFFLKGITNFLVIYQQLIPGSPNDTSVHSKINHTVFAEYDDSYNMVKSYIVPSQIDIKTTLVNPFYLHEMEMKGVPFNIENQYRTGKFLTDNHSYYWVQNDASGNFMSTDGSKLSAYKNNRDAAAFYVALAGEGLIPRKQFVSGNEADYKNGNHLLIPGIGYFDKLNGTWVTLQEEANNENPGLKLVWLQP